MTSLGRWVVLLLVMLGAGVGARKGQGDAVEIWDMRKGWIAKWAVGGSAGEGGVAGECSLPYLLSPSTHLI